MLQKSKRSEEKKIGFCLTFSMKLRNLGTTFYPDVHVGFDKKSVFGFRFGFVHMLNKEFSFYLNLFGLSGRVLEIAWTN